MKIDSRKDARSSDAGTVDWIVLTASAVALAIVIAASIQAGEKGLVANLASYVISRDT
ncbi:MAG: hypothetical protein HKN30_13040 [Sulfitobacter sp.]|nr:hypothetical protein [Sulfitobacter sp.]